MNAPLPTLDSPPAGAARYVADLSPAPHDEMVAAGGEVRPALAGVPARAGPLGLGEVTRRWEEARQLIRENGVTYNVYGDPRGMDRPWALDPIPLLISAAEYADLEAGLVQRARLLEADPRRPVRPAAAAPRGAAARRNWSSPIPASCGPATASARPAAAICILYAADLGRSAGRPLLGPGRPDAGAFGGRLRPGKPARPVAHAAGHVPRLPGAAAGPLLPHRSARRCGRSPPHHRDNPRIVLLTPGPYNETYFEHAYLARYLGYTLVEGGDLTVRDNRVYLKLLGGLQPVDVILRRLDDDYCDPLELRGDSFLGVPGLVQAVRAGNVAVANPLGSGLVETPALLAFLPALCRQLLGEELQTAVGRRPGGAATPTARDHVLANLRAHGHQADLPPAPGREPIFGERLPPRAAPGRWRIGFGPGRATTSARSSCRCPPRRCWPTAGSSRGGSSSAPS